MNFEKIPSRENSREISLEEFQKNELVIKPSGHKEKYKKIFVALTAAVMMTVSLGAIDKSHGMQYDIPKAEIAEQHKPSQIYEVSPDVVRVVSELIQEQGMGPHFHENMKEYVFCLEEALKYYQLEGLHVGDPQGASAEKLKELKGKLPAPFFGLYLKDTFIGNFSGTRVVNEDILGSMATEKIGGLLLESEKVGPEVKANVQPLYDALNN
jgi:hypothetical protein